jgi:hypothetical protein
MYPHLPRRLSLLLVLMAGSAMADFKDDVGYTQLVTELGGAAPGGSGVPVTQVEANTSTTAPPPVYLPDPANSAFAGKLITDRSNDTSGAFSGHATGVGRLFYGTATSMAPQITAIDAYLADDWLQSGFLRYGSNSKPRASTSRVANHSWAGSAGAGDSNILRRLDWAIETDEFIHAVGVGNTLASAAYNVIAVGRTDGVHSTGTSAIDADYMAGRVRPELVAPFHSPSSATPVVASVAAALVQMGRDNPGLSTDPLTLTTTNRSGTTIYNAERAEVIKAVLMAGGDRQTSNTTGADITDYRVAPANQTANGLDKRLGAGQVNIYNSYHILDAGEQNSAQDYPSGSGDIGVRGFDYDPEFGGSNGTNGVASYYFSIGGGGAQLYATLAWHTEIAGGNGPNFSGTATLHDLDLLLYDVTTSSVLVASSASSIDNTETLWETLTAGDYLLQVVPKGSLQWDYALAWRIETESGSDSDSDGVADTVDNCPQDPNTDQLDNDMDGAGDVCDADDDNDGTPDSQDAFPFDPAEDADTDGDGIGDNADSDDDGDGFSDSTELALGYDALDVLDAPQWGDVNNDGQVNGADVLLVSREVLGDPILSAAQQEVGRVAPLVNGQPAPQSGVALAAPDVHLITRKALGEISF